MTYIKPKSTFAAAAHVLSYSTLQAEPFIDAENNRIDWDGLYKFGMEGRYSDGEKCVVECALALWNGNGDELTRLGEIMKNLSAEPYRLVVEAMLALRPLKYEVNDIADPTEDHRWIRINRWQAEAVRAAASFINGAAGGEEIEDPGAVYDLGAELLTINEAWLDGQRG